MRILMLLAALLPTPGPEKYTTKHALHTYQLYLLLCFQLLLSKAPLPSVPWDTLGCLSRLDLSNVQMNCKRKNQWAMFALARLTLIKLNSESKTFGAENLMFTNSSLVLKTKSPLEVGAHQCASGVHPLISFQPKVIHAL